MSTLLSREEFDEITDKVFRLGMEMLSKTGGVSPAVFLALPVVHNGKRVMAILELDYSTDQKKYASFEMVVNLAKKAKAVGVWQASEAWALKQEIENIDTSIRPSKHPDRQEVLIVSGVSPVHRETIVVPYTRNDEGQVSIGAPLTRDSDGTFTSWMDEVYQIGGNA